MKIEEAIALANRVKPPRRASLDKLHASASATAAQLSAGADELNKRFGGMGETVSGLQKQVDQIAADVEYLENFTPGSLPRRTLQ